MQSELTEYIGTLTKNVGMLPTNGTNSMTICLLQLIMKLSQENDKKMENTTQPAVKYEAPAIVIQNQGGL